MNDNGDFFHSLFSNFTNDQLGDADCTSVNGLVKCLLNVTISYAATHNDANPVPGELSRFKQP